MKSIIIYNTKEHTQARARTPSRTRKITFDRNTIQYNAMQNNTIQYSTVQYNTIQYNTIQLHCPHGGIHLAANKNMTHIHVQVMVLLLLLFIEGLLAPSTTQGHLRAVH